MTIPSTVTTIGDNAFAHCSSLTSMTIPSSVTTIGDSAFASCTSLTSVMIPSSVTIIGYGAFSSCDSLTTVIVQGSHGITDTLQAAFSSHQVVFVHGALQELKELKAALIEQACRFNQSKLQDGQAPSLEVSEYTYIAISRPHPTPSGACAASRTSSEGRNFCVSRCQHLRAATVRA